MNLAAVANRHAAAARRYLAALCAAVLCVLWFFGICGLPLPEGINPLVNPSGYFMAQLLLFLLILPAAWPTLKSGACATFAMRPDAAALLCTAATAALADAALLAVRVALAADRGEGMLASRLAAESPLPLLGAVLTAAALAARLLLFLSIFRCASCVAVFRARFVAVFDAGVFDCAFGALICSVSRVRISMPR